MNPELLFKPRPPTVGRLKAQLAVMTAERDALARQLDWLRRAVSQVAHLADMALTLRAPAQITADPQTIRKAALDAIHDAKERQ